MSAYIFETAINMFSITSHSIVVNEDQWVWFAINSVRSLVSKMLIHDDNSTDKTAEIISSIKDSKIDFTRGALSDSGEHTKMRNLMVSKTKTDWFFILDGDEVWNKKTFEKFLSFIQKQPKNIWAVACRTRNCVGDVWHFQDESAGKYEIAGHKGNLTIRAFRKLPGFSWHGDYPLETWCDQNNMPINKQDEHLAFFDDFYWHMTFLPRSSNGDRVKGWRKTKFETGKKINPKDLPEVFFDTTRPKTIPDPLKSIGVLSSILATAVTIPKLVVRKLK